ncbi:MAG TPA: hypothetical protein VJC10_00835 [Patescibacteria group bacterium]|nr:hypothetical protein [Patescibacteria group bacterium]
MREFIKRFAVDRILWWGMIGSVISLLVTALYVIFVYNKLPPYVPLFNQMPWGEARLAEKVDIFLPMLIATAVFLSNLLIAYIIYDKLILVSRIISITSFLATFLTMIFIIRITLLVL